MRQASARHRRGAPERPARPPDETISWNQSSRRATPDVAFINSTAAPDRLGPVTLANALDQRRQLAGVRKRDANLNTLAHI